jgi:hypothetical protein
MNQIRLRDLNAVVEDLKTSLKSNVDDAKVRQIAKSELNKILKNLPKGVDESQILPILEKEFKGEKNKQRIIEEVINLLGKENFKNGKFVGGWNETQDTANIHKVFKPENFTNGEYTGGWNKQQDSQNLKQSLTDGEAKTLTSQIIEQKLGGSEKFSKGVFKSKEETINITKKSFQDGELREVIHDIFGPDKFYPNEWKEGDSFPKERAGKVKDDREVALQQAKYQDEIQATQGWLKFFKKHLIPSEKETVWRNKFGSNVEGAEDLYEDAKSKGKQKTGTDFADDEKRRIDKEAHTPVEIDKILDDIPIQRKKLAWDNFFREREGDSRINKDWEKNWRDSNLSIQIAEKIYDNGWNNSPNGLINKDKIIENYTTKTTAKGKDNEWKEHEKSTKNINPLKHLAEEIDSAHDFIVKEIDLQTDLNKFPTNETIEGAYNEKKVPNTINHEEVQNLRDKRIVELFKQYFQEKKPTTNLKDNEIELWRTAPTGLPNTGKDQRQAFDNGWTNPNQIENQQLKQGYAGIAEIKVLNLRKQDIDQEITKVDNLVKEINSYQHLRQLEARDTEINEILKNLNDNWLPQGKKEIIISSVEKQRVNLWYSLTEKDDGGGNEAEINEIEQSMRGTWKPVEYGVVTCQILEKFFKASGVKLTGEPNEDLKGWLTDSERQGFVVDERTLQDEDTLPPEQKGSYLLQYFYEKSCQDDQRQPFSTDRLDQDIYCKPDFQIKKSWRGEVKTPVIKLGQGHLAIGTGVGKTTKTINCMVCGGKRNIVLVCPNQTLVESAAKHHNDWLPNHGCVYHKEIIKARVRRGTKVQATQAEIDNSKASEDLVEIYKSHGPYPVAKNKLACWVNSKGEAGGLEPGKKGLSILYAGDLLGYFARDLLVKSKAMDDWVGEGTGYWSSENVAKYKEEISSKLIDKEEAIIVFDEAHFNSPMYQQLQIQAVHAGYKVLRMSATFPGKPFSITSSFPIKSVYLGNLDPNYIVEKRETVAESGQVISQNVTLAEKLANERILIFLKSLDLNADQKEALQDVSYVAFTREFDPYCESVSFGVQKGGIMLCDENHEMGMTFKAGIVATTDLVDVSNLEKRFTYSKAVTQPTSQASKIQQRGRVGRIDPGLFLAFSKKTQEIDPGNDVSAAMVTTIFEQDTSYMEKQGYYFLKDPKMLLSAVALPYRFGKPPEEILIGLNVDDDAEKSRVKKGLPLTKIEWRTAQQKPKALSVFGVKFSEPDDNLWKRFLGEQKPITMDANKAKDTLLNMFNNFVREDPNFPNKLSIRNQSNLISAVFGGKLDNPEAVKEEFRGILRGIVSAEIDKWTKVQKDEQGNLLSPYPLYDRTKRRSKDQKVIEKIYQLYRLTKANIAVRKERDNENKMVWTVRIQTDAIPNL